jgi:hypothetical protein
MITSQDLIELASVGSGTTLSFYLPTAPSSADTLQAPLHLKTLRQQALGLLESAGYKNRDAEAFLAPVDELIGKSIFWQHQRHGLALFVGESIHRHFSLEKSVEPVVFLGAAAEVTPLLDQLASEDQFLVVALSQAKASAYLGSDQGLSALDVYALPESIDQVAGSLDKENTAYAAPTERPHIGDVSFAHGQSYGDSPSEWDQQRQVLYAELLEKALAPLIGSHGLPRVLVADENLAGIVAAKLSFTAIDHTHPESLDEKALHALSLKALGDHRSKAESAETESVLQRWGQNDKVATTLDEIHQAATEGRVGTLVVSTTTPHPTLTSALHATLATGGSLQYLSEPNPLFPEGAIALLRY